MSSDVSSPESAVAAALTPPASPSGSDRVREEAASLFAYGQTEKAGAILLRHIEETHGTCPVPVWMMLLDVYQASGQIHEFEKLATVFARHCGVSPPPWEPLPATPVQARHGLNTLVVDGFLHATHPSKARDFIEQSRECGKSRLDLSRAQLSEDAELHRDGALLLLGLMHRLRRNRIPTLLMGEVHLVEQIRASVRTLNDSTARPYWLLLLEFMQWRAQRTAFEELAERYASRFSESPPDYDVGGAVAVSPGDDPIDDEGGRDWNPTAEVDLPPRLDEPSLHHLLGTVDRSIEYTGQVRLNARNLRSLSYEASLSLAGHIHSRGYDADALVMVQPSELVRALLDMTGVSAVLTVERRKTGEPSLGA